MTRKPDPADRATVVANLVAAREGEVVGGLYHRDIGLIDVKWGKAGTGRGDGYGLAKIVAFHPEVLADLPRLLQAMAVDEARSGNNRTVLVSDRHKAIVSTNWHGLEQRWLLTAFRKR